MKSAFLLTVTLLFLSGCTVVNVSPVNPDIALQDVCVEKNPNVTIDDFTDTVQNGFKRHGIKTRVVSRPAPDNCDFLLSYTALEEWDVVFYMHQAALRLEHKGKFLGSAEYHLRGGGGLSLLKYQSTKTKLDPVIDELLANASHFNEELN